MRKMLALAAGAALVAMAGVASADEAKGTVTQIDSTGALIHVDTGSKELIFAMSPSNTAGVKIGDLMVGDKVDMFYSFKGSSENKFNAMHVMKEE